MTYQTPTMSMEWIKEHIPEPIPMSDKTRLHEILDILSHENHTIPEKEGALNALGKMSIRYGAYFIIMCGSIPLIKQYLTCDNKILSLQAARSIKYIAQSGGIEELVVEGVHKELKYIIIDIHKDFDLRDSCATAYGWILAEPPSEIKNDII